METTLIKLLGRKRQAPATSLELLQLLKLGTDQQESLSKLLRELEHRGLVVRLKGGRYLASDSPALVEGRIQITRAGRGFVAVDDPSIPEISVRSADTGTALHDDQVLVFLSGAPTKRWGAPQADEASGIVVSVLERRRTRYVGILKREGKAFSVSPDDPRFTREIEASLSPEIQRRAKPGDKVVVELTRWDSRHSPPVGKVVEVLGAPSANGVDMLGVLRQYELEHDFPADAMLEAQSFGRQVKGSELAGRRDCRSQQVVTIDPDDARDFDDAICLEPAGRKRWRLWVHIADVSHYVRPGSALDREARRRGNSSYLVDRVVPMLPEALSNELCSLKPKVDRLTKCVEFLLSDDGKVLATDFYPAVIHSQRRYTYAEAMTALERKPGNAADEMLHRASELAQAIRLRRFAAGSLNLDFPETKIRLDTQGRIERIDQHENDRSHQLVEEFMLLANEAVASRLMKLKRPALYRTHEAPDSERLERYREELRGHAVPCGNLAKPGEVGKLLLLLGGMAAGAALKVGFLRSLNRARYTADPLGHYGLAKKKYTHFTSPIRRYADLVVHRSLFESGKKRGKEAPLHEVADHLSASERNSSDAERDSKEVKLHAYLREQIRSGSPLRYSAQVTALRDFGFSVDIVPLGMGGMVPLSLMSDDHYVHEAGERRIRGRRTRRDIRLGDTVEVEVAKVDPVRKLVDFRLVGSPIQKSEGKPRRRRKGGPKGGGAAAANQAVHTLKTPQEAKAMSGEGQRRRPRRRKRGGSRTGNKPQAV